MTSGSLSGKTAWVTGSSRGIGRVVAEHLASVGVKVAVHGTSRTSTRSFSEADSLDDVVRQIMESTGGTVMAVTGDLTDPDAVHAVAARIRDAWGRIDILVNCAGGDIGSAGTSGPNAGKPAGNNPVDISVLDIRTVMDRNFMTTVLCCREVAPEMRERRAGSIVNVGSISGLFGMDNSAIYACSKAAVHEYTRCLAVHLRPYNVRVNAVAPGEIVTARFKASRPLEEDRMVESGKLERYGRPIEVARTIEFLASDQASYISGQVLRVDGAQQCWPS